MSGKYYTPEITEFYIGFEYRLCDIDTGKYVNFAFQDGQSVENLLDGDYGEVDVKCLDKNDIESIGFKCTGGAMVEGGKSYFEKGVYGITLRPNYYKNGSPDVHVYKYRPVGVTIDTRFSGEVKNKSEIKKLLRQLNIETDEK